MNEPLTAEVVDEDTVNDQYEKERSAIQYEEYEKFANDSKFRRMIIGKAIHHLGKQAHDRNKVLKRRRKKKLAKINKRK